ncbi:hypothetical protein [Clostridium chrysemydis]|uniref:hypothetical protein n=1 Tax=Clostridium chrysemydis TaxID=2665504 RepID=UPI003F67A276
MRDNNFKIKRIEYLNNWPNIEPFEIEKQYCENVKKLKSSTNTIFKPFLLKSEENSEYNKAISFMIDAIEELEKYPNHSFEFMFKAYDAFSKVVSSGNITERNIWLCDNKWALLIESSPELQDAIQLLFKLIPMKSCQYIYTRICDRNSRAYKRLTNEISGRIDYSKRKNIIESIENKYRYEYNMYSESIRPASALYRYMLRNEEIDVNGTKYTISMCDKLHFIVSGYIYTLRNDSMHGNNMSITKSSKANMSTYANNYYAFLFMYYLVIILMLDKYSEDYSMSKYKELAQNIKQNVELYKKLFRNNTER